MARAQQCKHGSDETSDEKQWRVQAVNAVRIINTVEVNHKTLYGKFLPFSELPNSPVVERMHLKDGPWGRIFKAMFFAPNTDVLPGFELRFTLGEDGYSVAITDKTDPCRRSFFSDQIGIIYEGQPIGSPQP